MINFEQSKYIDGQTYLVSTKKEKLNLAVLHRYLSNAYWCLGRSKEIIQASIENSLNFGLYKGEEQIGFARVVTDYATIAYLADVFILESYQGKGLGFWLVKCVVKESKLNLEKGWFLRTKDAHSLYEKVGFQLVEHPERIMDRKGDTNVEEL